MATIIDHTIEGQLNETSDSATRRDDAGYTMVELLIVVLILGVLGSVAWLAVTGMTSEAAESGCLADKHQLHVAAESYFAQTASSEIPATGTDSDRFERTLVKSGLLRSVSELNHVAASGAVTPEAPSC